MELRPYQTAAVNELREGFKTHQRQVLAIPTGSGKTIIFSHMTALAYNKETQTLILTHRSELLKQTMKAIGGQNIPIQIINPENKMFYKDAPISIGMVETVKRRKLWDKGFNPTLIVVDECHFGNFTPIFEHFPNAKVIGCSATPVGKHFYKYYTNIVANVGIPELVDEGFLVKCLAFQMQDDFSKIEIKRGDFVEAQLFTHFNKSKLYAGVIEKYKEKINGQKTLVFNCNIEHAEKMNKEFNDAGIRSECITSKTSDEDRVRILSAFKNGLFPVLNNANILTTGFDDPSIQAIIMNRATFSLPLFLQCAGRGSRPFPGKTHFTLLDFGMNHERHGMWNEEREWTLEPPRKKKKAGPAPVKSCPRCSAMLAASSMKCEFCGHEFERKANDPQEGVMVEVKNKVPESLRGKRISELTIPQLVDLSKSGAVSKIFIWRVVRSKGAQAVDDYGWKVGYKGGWATNQLKEMDDVKFRDRIL